MGVPHRLLRVRAAGPQAPPLTLSAVEQINDYRISAVRADASEQLLLNRGMDESRIISANRLSQALKMLVSGRADLLATGKLAGYDAIKALQLDANDFTVAFVLDAEELCYAFSRQVDDGVIKQFQRALTQALASSEYQRLQLKYLSVP